MKMSGPTPFEFVVTHFLFRDGVCQCLGFNLKLFPLELDRQRCLTQHKTRLIQCEGRGTSSRQRLMADLLPSILYLCFLDESGAKPPAPPDLSQVVMAFIDSQPASRMPILNIRNKENLVFGPFIDRHHLIAGSVTDLLAFYLPHYTRSTKHRIVLSCRL